AALDGGARPRRAGDERIRRPRHADGRPDRERAGYLPSCRRRRRRPRARSRCPDSGGRWGSGRGRAVRRPTVSHWFDDAARGLSEGRVTRRAVLRRGGAVAAGTLVGSLTLPGWTFAQ